MSDVLTLNVYLQNNDYVKKLEQHIELLKRENTELQVKFQKLCLDYGHVQHVNMELIDTMKHQGYKFRKQSDIRTWNNQKGE